MQSDAKSAFCKKSHPNDRPGLHFGGLWGHFGALWAPNGTPEAFFCAVEISMQKRERTQCSGALKSGRERGGGVPIINL